MYEFHVTIHAAIGDAVKSSPMDVGGAIVHPLQISSNLLQSPLAVTFDEAAEALRGLPRLFFEPDGSFVWVSSDENERWQVDGNLCDMGPRLMYAEIRGRCPEESFDQLLRACGWPRTELIFQTLTPSLLLDEADFRRVAATYPSVS